MSARSMAVVQARLRELRQTFDEGFARAEAEQDAEPILLLGLHVGMSRFAVPIADLAGVHPCSKIAPLPTGPEGLLGLAGVRGRLYAVYALGALLGVDASAEAPRWLLLAKGAESVAFAVSDVDAHLRAKGTELRPFDGARGGYVGWLLEQGARRLGVLDVRSLLSTIEQRTPVGRRAR
ncbi:chemotaxis protein CheW [Chondromyces crocatus]|uniref:CheW-like domain-containing protein n=1 Tax=Chondromyces crocatus TaxID=52 RepID=A0A0K1ERX4_CHOCO|nr:chemotaxis protein CheW [Chondromyces crocatus]AKT43670.1 uncharacterized protein CMC5_079050 [Chondromyces crocatus]